MKPKVYLETTVPSYLTAWMSRDLIMAARQQITREWWERRLAHFDAYISQLVLDEAAEGDADAAKRRLAVVAGFPLLTATPETEELAVALVERKLLPPVAADDAVHIALAAAHGMDFLLTWNFKHIANAETVAKIAQACRDHGFACPVICTPEELRGDES